MRPMRSPFFFIMNGLHIAVFDESVGVAVVVGIGVGTVVGVRLVGVVVGDVAAPGVGLVAVAAEGIGGLPVVGRTEEDVEEAHSVMIILLRAKLGKIFRNVKFSLDFRKSVAKIRKKSDWNRLRWGQIPIRFVVFVI